MISQTGRRANSVGALAQTGAPAPNPKRPAAGLSAFANIRPPARPGALSPTVMAGARVREAIRVYVEVDTYNDDGYVKVTYARTIIAELDNIAQRTEILVSTTIPKMSAVEAKTRRLPSTKLPNEGAVEIVTSGRKGNVPLSVTRKTVSREQAGLDLSIFNSYVKKVVAYRESPEYAADANHVPLPTKQAEEVNKDMSTATAAGTVPFTIGGGIGAAVGKKLIPRQLVRSRMISRWMASKLGPALGKAISSSDVAAKLGKIIGSTGLTNSVDTRQSAMGAEYLDPSKHRLYVYTDFKMGGQSIYSRDVSPDWVHEAHHWLYKCVFGPIEWLLKLI